MMERIRQALKNPSLRARLLMALAALAGRALLPGEPGGQGRMTSEEKSLPSAGCWLCRAVQRERGGQCARYAVLCA